MSRNAQGVVAVVFTVLALSFIATTAVLYYEFKNHQWFTIAAFYSHLFIFFPTFGILALFAFFLPASALLDLYWSNHVRYGKLRFMIATMALAAISLAISSTLVTGVPAIWWLSPETLVSDKGRPENCAAPRCTRLPVMESIAEVRRVSQHRAGLSPFARSCDADNLMGVPPEQLQKRQ